MSSSKEIFTMISLGIGCVGGVIAAFKALSEMKHNLAQRKIEHRWKQTHEARKFLSEMKENYKSSSALQMLDWSGRAYHIGKEEEEERISFSDVETALRIKDLTFSPKEGFVRDCFDELFEQFENIEHFIRNDFVRYQDVEAPLEYYAEKLLKSSYYEAFMKEYGYSLAIAFTARFKH